MTDYHFPQVPEIETAYRTAYRALRDIISPNSFVREDKLPVTEVVSEFRSLIQEAELTVAAEIGPRISWEAQPLGDDWDLVVSGIDLDTATIRFSTAVLGQNAFDTPGNWEESALGRAALVYRRACGWDFAPGAHGIWLVMLAPVSALEVKSGLWHYTGNLTGFMILYDRSREGVYDSVGHIWTAVAWQRKGIARRLLTEARSRFQVKEIEEPYTADGAAFLGACANDLL
ncbi:hypothetical protein [Spongiactinospora gelatinilytica]|uniref:hypothetical protein n=1 Tax=Spongiactinospora gelatinilytica TaxID=2666298 RepID=UPI0011B93550|nr:hypothetical protein [Spongiactinospora gelatinilytica]